MVPSEFLVTISPLITSESLTEPPNNLVTLTNSESKSSNLVGKLLIQALAVNFAIKLVFPANLDPKADLRA